MNNPTIGILSPGDMGHAIGRVLVDHGLTVISCLEGRSQRTRVLAGQAGIKSVPDYGQLVREANMILSVLVPSEAKKAANEVSKALKATGSRIIFVDCNAVAPMTVKEIGEIIIKAGSRFIDASIIGSPPNPKSFTRFYASGADADELLELNKFGLDIRVIGQEIGQASGLKMVYAASTKGYSALSIELLVAAWRMGLYEALIDEFKLSQAERLASLNHGLQTVPSKSKRWIGEMEEIAKTFASLGLTPRILEGAADMFKFVSENPVARETPETIDRKRSLEQLVQQLAEGEVAGNFTFPFRLNCQDFLDS
jgi:3-hydroxyisobutyrate dehydrogenase-like beta-hydroxyacid dehydrogenase